MAAQIHMAGRTSTTVSRQLDKTSLSPSNSMAKAPTAIPSGAKMRRRLLS